jgi:hypothetical protein
MLEGMLWIARTGIPGAGESGAGMVTVVLPPRPCSRPAGQRAPRLGGGGEPASGVVSSYRTS